MSLEGTSTESDVSEDELDDCPVGQDGTNEDQTGCSISSCPSDTEEVKVVKRGNRPVRSKARRVAANIRERRRILDYNQGFNALRTVLKHDLSGKRLSKIATLRRAIHHIAALSSYLRTHTETEPNSTPCTQTECYMQQEGNIHLTRNIGSFQEPVENYLHQQRDIQRMHKQTVSPEIPLYQDTSNSAHLCPPSPHYSQQVHMSHHGHQWDDQSSDYYSGGSRYQHGMKVKCHQNHIETYEESSNSALALQLGYLQYHGYQQSLSMH